MKPLRPRTLLLILILSGLSLQTQYSSSEESDANSEDLVATLLAEAEKAAKEEPAQTKAGQMLANREMARQIVSYGLKNSNPEAIIVGVQILHENPTKSAQKQEGAANADVEHGMQLIEKAVSLRENDESLLVLAERVADELQESTRGLAGGPKSWIVEIPKRGYYQLDPRLVYNSHEAAIITAFPNDKDNAGVMLGGSVRREDQRKVMKKTAGRGKVIVQWNSGIHTTGWDCRIYNLNGPDKMKVRVESN